VLENVLVMVYEISCFLSVIMAVVGHPAAIGRELGDPVTRVNLTFGSRFLAFAGDRSFKVSQ